MTDLNNAILTALAQHASYLYRLSTGEVNKQVGIFDSIMESKVEKIATILRNLNESERVAMRSGQYNTDRLKRLRDLLSDWQSELQSEMYPSFEKSAIVLAGNESEFTAKIAGDSVAALSGEKVYKDSVKFPVVGGQLVSELFSSLAIATAENVRNNIRNGISNGWTNDQILRSITGSEDVPSEPSVARSMKIEIERTIRTARMHVANSAYIDTYKAMGYTHVKVVATLDSRTCGSCARADGSMYPIDSNFPHYPQHPNSRTVLVGVMDDGVLIGRRPYVADPKGRSVKDIPKGERDDIIGQVNSNTDYKTWFANQSVEFQKEWLGATKYKLYKEGGFSLDKFADVRGNTYTIAQLRELDAKIFKELGL